MQDAYAVLLREQAARRPSETSDLDIPTQVFRVVNAASVPERPYFPKLWLFSLVGFLTGLLAGLGAAFLAEAHDRSVRSAEELEALLDLPVLAEIPVVRRTLLGPGDW